MVHRAPCSRRRPAVFARLGRWCHDHRRAVILLWVAVVLVGGGILGAVGKQSKSQFELPNVESKKGSDILDASFGGQGAGFGGNIVFRADRSVNDPSVEAPMTKFLAAVDDIPKVSVSSPYAPEGERQISQLGATAGKLAFADVELPNITNEQASKIKDKIDALTPHIDGVDIELGGEVFADFQAPSSEALGLAFAVVILLLAFGSVLAMGLPVGVALAGIAVGSIVAGLLSHLVAAPDFASILGVMIGLGVGIDYALFIVTRFRENMHNGHDVRQSTIIAIDTAGRAVLFAGTTVCISLLGMIIMGMSFVTGLAVSAAAVVAVTIVASLTVLETLPGFAGSKVEVTRWRGLIAACLLALALVGAGLGLPAVATPLILLAVLVLVVGIFWGPLKRQVPRRERPEPRRTFAYRWSRLIQHPPRPAGTARPPGLPLPRAPRAPAPPGAGVHRRPRGAARPRRPDPQPAARVLRRGELPEGHADQEGLRPAGRGLRARLQRATDPGRHRPCRRPRPGRAAAGPAVREQGHGSCVRVARDHEPEQEGGAVAGHPDHPPPGPEEHEARRPAPPPGAGPRPEGVGPRRLRH